MKDNTKKKKVNRYMYLIIKETLIFIIHADYMKINK